MKSQLVTWTSGLADGLPMLLLHDRHGPGDGSVDPLAQALVSSHQLVVVRSARTQSERSKVRGHYWHLGPYDLPEISTLGDALYHLEGLMLEVHRHTGRKITLFGRGEGGGVALLMGLVRPEIVAGVVSVDGPLATNLDQLPMSWPDAAGLNVLLLEDARQLEASQSALGARGAQVQRIGPADAGASDVLDFVRGLEA